ncbi:MAG: maltose O-acetyltransferase [Chitinivibrionales bacterium]|nr:maltose O-acetyltransferase [Chitinivibrionales bacterium]
MINGEWFYANDTELDADRIQAYDLTTEYNATTRGEDGKRRSILKTLLGASCEDTVIVPPFRCDFGYNIFIEKNFYCNMGLVILDEGPVKIGHSVAIGPNLHIYTAHHPLDNPFERAKGMSMGKPVTIGNYVWMGGGVIINPGVTIGEYSIIGSGSVVTKNIPPRVVAVGNPCRPIRDLSIKEPETS